MEFFNWRKDACVEKECEITPREEELERKKHANATAEQKALRIYKLGWRRKRRGREKEGEQWRREVLQVKHLEQEWLKKLIPRSH